MENVGEDQETVEICNRESSARISSSGNNFGKPSVCSTKEQTKQTEERNISEKDVRSDNSKFYDSGYVSNQIFSSKSQSCSTRSTLFGNTTNDCGKDAVKRKPFRQLNYNNNRGTDRQTIWRPWWMHAFLKTPVLEWIRLMTSKFNKILNKFNNILDLTKCLDLFVVLWNQ